ncbi:MAG TPA: polyhydroxyalkanoate synthesis regulator DNA-binding domain-containing protein [Steroidobacteraceae bacterium]|nr:polyhydroxyalkanoate synthesis regulator DNA-binding domain-containing protein [Steroidobacteraceae bacterium]
MNEPRLIKKYPNRRLYDTELSRYVTIEDVRQLIAGNTRLRIIEQRSGLEITRAVLLQVVAELELSPRARLSELFLTELIQSYDVAPGPMIAAQLEATLRAELEAAANEAPRSAAAG